MFNGFKRKPKKGEIWLASDGSPWPTGVTVTILDVAKGWVRYTYSTPLISDCRCPINIFLSSFSIKRGDVK